MRRRPQAHHWRTGWAETCADLEGGIGCGYPMKTQPARLVGALVLSVLAPVALAQNRPFTSQYSFGDSLSDNGNLYALTSRTQPASPPYYQGRFSNGPTFVELLG